MTNKALLREQIRQQMALHRSDQSDQLLLDRFLALPQVTQAQCIGLYYGVGHEVTTVPLLSALWALGKTTVLPRCLPQRGMAACIVTDLGQLEPGAFQIPQPNRDCPLVEWGTIDILLVPALCYDREGYRLGQGGGYYDRILSHWNGFSVGLCREALLQNRVPRETHDCPVRLVVTEREFFPTAQPF